MKVLDVPFFLELAGYREIENGWVRNVGKNQRWHIHIGDHENKYGTQLFIHFDKDFHLAKHIDVTIFKEIFRMNKAHRDWLKEKDKRVNPNWGKVI